ncbi:MAG: hypothetical protein ACTTJH_03830 [Bacteroidales bacterium]
MEKFYIFSELTMWENDLLMAEMEENPSRNVIDTIIDYSMEKEFYSKSLGKSIAISIN